MAPVRPLMDVVVLKLGAVLVKVNVEPSMVICNPVDVANVSVPVAPLIVVVVLKLGLAFVIVTVPVAALTDMPPPAIIVVVVL